ncbi:MAG TPA: outer membrane beta-barrel protein, partial [Polyangiaceae bacterium]|nr:outer membrane beta-barrel protein [Polyangiaceae bacterium]
MTLLRNHSAHGFITGAALVLLASLAHAQGMTESAAQPPADQPSADQSPAPAAPTPPDQAEAAAAEKQESASESNLHLSAFVDANYAYTTAHSNTPVAAHRAFEANTGDALTHNGFNLSWFGVDANYDDGKIGATGSLRFGTAVPVYLGGNKTDLGIENLTQAFATWHPYDKLQLDFGQFSTIYGAEVAESWKNLNYTRGALYFLMQPAWHTGMRVIYTPISALTVTGLVVNGANTVVDDDSAPSLGLQLAYAPTQRFSLNAGYLGAVQPKSSGDNFDNLFDLVSTVHAGDFTLILNGDLAFSQRTAQDFNAAGAPIRTISTPTYFGGSLALGYQFSHLFGAALRGEFLQDHHNRLYRYNNVKRVNTGTVTATLDLKPIEKSDNLVIRWDNRIEASNHDIFANKSGTG